MTNSAFLELVRFKEKINKTPLFVKNSGVWALFDKSIFSQTHTVSLQKDFDVYCTGWADRIYTYDDNNNPTQFYIFHPKDNPPELTKLNYNNLYDLIRAATRIKEPEVAYLHPYYKEKSIYLINGYHDHIFIPLKDETGNYEVIFFKFFIDTNPDLYWGKDLTSHGDITNQLKYIFGKNFYNLLYNPLELVSSVDNSKLMKLPDYELYFDNPNDKKSENDPEIKIMGRFNSCFELSDKFPNGADGIFIVGTENDHTKYIWNGNNWIPISRYDKNVTKTVKRVLDIREDPEFEYTQLPDQEIKQTELNFDEFYQNKIGFQCEPTYSTLELRKFFLYGFVTGSLSIGIILSILALICNYL